MPETWVAVREIVFYIYGLSFLTGVLLLMYAGTKAFQHERKLPNLFSASLLVLRNTFLFLFLPAFLIAGSLLLWAYLTHQPIFQQ